MGVAKKIIEGGLEAIAKKSARAKDLERKAAESYAQMPEYLQDPYLGLSTSNIGKVTKSLLQKAPRMSKAELEASGFYHPIGRGLKLSKPAQEYTADIIDDPDMPLVPKKIVSPEDLYGKVGIPLVGDRSDTGKLLRGIEGVTFDDPLKLEGGHKFGRAHQYKDPKVSSVWASDPGVVTALNNQIRRAAESGKDVLGVSSMGSPEMVDYNTMIAKSALNMTDLEGIHPKAIKAFNDEIKNLAKKNKETGKITNPFKNFLGIDHPEVTTQLLSKDAGELRKAFIRTMEKDEYRKLGFPELAPIRKAVINPEILDMPLGSTGLDIYKMSPEGNIVEAPKNPHSTYPVHMQGEYFGGLELPIDYKNMFSTFYEPKRLLSVPDRHAYRAYSLSAPIQEFNQQWLDEVMPIYQQKIKDITGRKKGGEVHPDGSARLANGASARKTVEYLLKDQEDYAGGGIAKKIAKHLIPEPKQPFIGYIKKSGDHESYSHDAAKAVDYHHSHLMKDPDAMFADDALTFVRYQGEPIFTIKGESVLDPYHPESAKHISTLAELLKRNGADPNTPLRIEDLALPREQAPYQGKQIGTLQDWIDMPKNKYAGGGIAKKIAKKLAQEIELPPASNSARTQIVGTMPTYEKARDILRKEGIEGKDVIDFGAGKGLGSTMMKADSFEPYPQGWYPTYTKSEDIPSDAYKGLLNLNVLNVLDPEMRAHTVKEIGRVMQPEGGTGLITTRGRDVMNTIGGKAGPEPMSVITSRDTYQKGFEPNELREYIKYILGSDFEYEPLNLGPAGVKIKKKAEGGSIDEPETLKEVPRTGKISGKIADILKPASRFLEKYEIIPQIPLIGGTDLAELTGVKGVQTLAEDMSYGYKPIRNLERGKLQSSYFDPRLADAVDLGTTALGGVGLAKNLGKTAIREGMKQIETGTGMLGRNVINPRMNIIKDPGGMVVGGEKVLDTELLNMKKNEALNVDMTGANTLPEMFARREVAPKDPNAVALNQWIDTKVRKYIRNQAGTEADPILKAIESGVEHKFSPAIGDTKYYVRHKRELIGKPVEGIAKTDLGKEWEYKVDSTFTPKKSADIKEILNMPMEHLDSPAVRDRRRASMLRVEQDLPIHDEKDLEALKLINQIPDENVYTIDVSSLTNRLGLNHVSDVLYEDLQTGRLRPEQLNQMSIEKAIRRTAEYDAEKAKAMTKAHATSIEGMPIPKAYDDGYKWVELKHETDPKKTAAALKSEGEMMGHCVGGYCGNVESGEIKIFSLRGPDGKSHVTIEARPRFNAQQWYEANADLINSDPYLKEIEPNVALGDIDAKYGNNPSSDSDYIRIMTKEMKKKGINPVEPSAYMELHQVKGKQNKRPDDKYQSYISDFIKNNPTKHEIVDVFELDNTNLMGAQNVADSGLVPKDIHFHPEVTKALKIKYPPFDNLMAADKEDMTYDLFKEVARDLARQGKNYLDKDDILNHLREKYLLPKKKSGGSINLNQEYKLENLRRRYG